MYETNQQSVKLKQQSIEFRTDFHLPVVSDYLVHKTLPTADSRPSSPSLETKTFLPISIRLNRKGLIDSEVIAVGKLLVPLQSGPGENGIKNHSIGLFTSEDNLEIAIARLSVQANVDSISTVGRIIAEMESLMIQYAKNSEGFDDVVITDSLQRFLIAVTPVRRFSILLGSALHWEPSYVKSWLFLLTISVHPLGLPLYLTVLLFISTRTPIPFFQYLPLKAREDDFPAESVSATIEANLIFLSDVMNSLASLSDFILRLKGEYIVGLIVLFLLIPNSEYWFILAYMAFQTFWCQGIVLFISKRKFLVAGDADSPSEFDDGEYSVFENQRWWLGKWSDRLINNEAHSWASTPKNSTAQYTPKDSFTLPISDDDKHQWKWDGPWQLDGSEDGWTYATDFRQPKFHTKQEITDFVRRRRWHRKFKRVSKH